MEKPDGQASDPDHKPHSQNGLPSLRWLGVPCTERSKTNGRCVSAYIFFMSFDANIRN